MKKRLSLSLLVLLSGTLFGCSLTDDNTETKEKTVQMANPASKYCIEQGGESQIVTNEDGSQYGNCLFSDGTIVEEWEFFRASQADKN